MTELQELFMASKRDRINRPLVGLLFRLLIASLLSLFLLYIATREPTPKVDRDVIRIQNSMILR